MKLCESSAGVPTIPNLRVEEPKTADEVFELLKLGNRRRSQAPTDQNKESSRSHAILQVTVKSKPLGPAVNHELLTATLNLVDLAGSERCQKNRGERFVEGRNINKSLLQLGNCINALASKGAKFIPYRNSKLTFFLKDSLGGQCKTVMICNVSPSRISYNEVWQTLCYANRAKNIRIDPKKNQGKITYHFTQWQQMLRNSAKRQQELQDKLEDVVKKLRQKEKDLAEATAQIIRLQQTTSNDENEEITSDIEKLDRFKSALESCGENAIVTRISEKLSEIETLKLERDEISSRIGLWEKEDQDHVYSPSYTIITKQRENLKSKEREIDELQNKITDWKKTLLAKIGKKKAYCRGFLNQFLTSNGKQDITKIFEGWKSDLQKEQSSKKEKTEILLRNYFELYIRSSESIRKIFQTLEQFYQHCRKLATLTPELRELFGTSREIMTQKDIFYDPTLIPSGIQCREQLRIDQVLSWSKDICKGKVLPPSIACCEQELCESSERQHTNLDISVSIDEEDCCTDTKSPFPSINKTSSADVADPTSSSLESFFDNVNLSTEEGKSGLVKGTLIDFSPSSHKESRDMKNWDDSLEYNFQELEKARRELDIEVSPRAALSQHASNGRSSRMKVKAPAAYLKNVSKSLHSFIETDLTIRSRYFVNPVAEATSTQLHIRQDQNSEDENVFSISSEIDDHGERFRSTVDCLTCSKAKNPEEGVSNLESKTTTMVPLELKSSTRSSQIVSTYGQITPQTQITADNLSDCKLQKEEFFNSHLRRPSVFCNWEIQNWKLNYEHYSPKRNKTVNVGSDYEKVFRGDRVSIKGSIYLPILETKLNDIWTRPGHKRRPTRLFGSTKTLNHISVRPGLAGQEMENWRPLWM